VPDEPVVSPEDPVVAPDELVSQDPVDVVESGAVGSGSVGSGNEGSAVVGPDDAEVGDDVGGMLPVPGSPPVVPTEDGVRSSELSFVTSTSDPHPSNKPAHTPTVDSRPRTSTGV
jgi:hypothetical protein